MCGPARSDYSSCPTSNHWLGHLLHLLGHTRLNQSRGALTRTNKPTIKWNKTLKTILIGQTNLSRDIGVNTMRSFWGESLGHIRVISDLFWQGKPLASKNTLPNVGLWHQGRIWGWREAATKTLWSRSSLPAASDMRDFNHFRLKHFDSKKQVCPNNLNLPNCFWKRTKS